MKKTIVIVLILIIAGFLIFMKVKLDNEKKKLAVLKIENVDIKKVRNGEYIGECYLDLKTAKVNVAVKDGIISKIDIIEHTHGPGHGADKITDSIIKKQSLEVDAISGATKSSIVIRKAVGNALRKGL